MLRWEEPRVTGSDVDPHSSRCGLAVVFVIMRIETATATHANEENVPCSLPPGEPTASAVRVRAPTTSAKYTIECRNKNAPSDGTGV
jgi:hypothetical protein